MAATVSQDLQVSWHPFACSDTLMRPNTLLMAKLTFLLLLVSGFPRQIFAGFVPWWAAGDFLAQLEELKTVFAVVFLLSGAAILLNRFVRHASLAAGAVVFLVLLLSQSAFHAGLLLCGCILVLGGFQGRRDDPSFVQWQMVVAHFALLVGATNGVNWIGALTADFWLPESAGNSLLSAVARMLPAGWFNHGLGWLVIGTELLLTIGLAVRPLRRPALFVSLAFHSALYGFMGTGELAVLVAAMAIGSLSFVRWPQTTITAIWPRACGWPVWLRVYFERTDWDQRIDWPMPRDPDGELEVSRDGVAMRGWSGLCTLLLFHPACYFALFFVLVTLVFALPAPAEAPVNAALALACVLFFARPEISRLGSRKRPTAAESPTPSPI